MQLAVIALHLKEVRRGVRGVKVRVPKTSMSSQPAVTLAQIMAADEEMNIVFD